MSRECKSEAVFDEEIYAKAKPLLITIASDLKDVRLDLREAMTIIVRIVVDRLGVDVAQNMAPYVVGFIAELREGVVSARWWQRKAHNTGRQPSKAIHHGGITDAY